MIRIRLPAVEPISNSSTVYTPFAMDDNFCGFSGMLSLIRIRSSIFSNIESLVRTSFCHATASLADREVYFIVRRLPIAGNTGEISKVSLSRSIVTVVRSANVVCCLRNESSRNLWFVISSSPTRWFSAHIVRTCSSSSSLGSVDR